MNEIKLTQYSHGAGCGCKISPKVLSTILKTNLTPFESPNLLVGNESRDDAAVYDMHDGTAIISTTDFLCPLLTTRLHLEKLLLRMPSAMCMQWEGSLCWRLQSWAGQLTNCRPK